MGKQERPPVPLLGVGGADLECVPALKHGGPHGKSLAVHSILDRLVSIHRAGAESAYGFAWARSGRGDGGFHGAETRVSADSTNVADWSLRPPPSNPHKSPMARRRRT